jgi:hypothetical protein
VVTDHTQDSYGFTIKKNGSERWSEVWYYLRDQSASNTRIAQRLDLGAGRDTVNGLDAILAFFSETSQRFCV